MSDRLRVALLSSVLLIGPTVIASVSCDAASSESTDNIVSEYLDGATENTRGEDHRQVLKQALTDMLNLPVKQLYRTGDIWISEAEDHAGLVVRVMPNLHPRQMPEITIRHDSSRQNGVATNDFERYFHGQGWFCR